MWHTERTEDYTDLVQSTSIKLYIDQETASMEDEMPGEYVPVILKYDPKTIELHNKAKPGMVYMYGGPGIRLQIICEGNKDIKQFFSARNGTGYRWLFRTINTLDECLSYWFSGTLTDMEVEELDGKQAEFRMSGVIRVSEMPRVYETKESH